jgi:hypothetical protein
VLRSQANYLLLDIEPMIAQARRPSRTVAAGTEAHVDDPEFLIGRWRKSVEPEQERDLLKIAELFDLDFYRPGSLTSHLGRSGMAAAAVDS